MIAVVALGFALVLTCIALLFLPQGESYKTTLQKFSGLGLNIEISMLTVMALFGVGLALVPVLLPVYWQMQQVSSQLDEAKRDRESARGEVKTLQHTLEKAQKFDVWVLVTLDGVTEDTRPKLSDIVSNYSVFGEREPISAAVTYGVAANQLRVLLTDVDRKTVVQRLVIDEPGRRRWAYDSFVPMEPTFVLKKER